jgi:nucleotide-binding universal stress UspA family protein
MFKKVVCATDGSAGADMALGYAKTLAMDAHGELLIVHGVELQASAASSKPLHEQSDENEMEAKIERQVAELGEKGVKATVQMVPASASGVAHVIADVALAEDADVIVAGTRGHTVLAGLLLGSVTQRLLHIAPCPVLVVPGARDQTSG